MHIRLPPPQQRAARVMALLGVREARYQAPLQVPLPVYRILKYLLQQY